jgi:hypothetical protein
MDMNQNEDRINRTLASIEGLQRVPVSEECKVKIIRSLHSPQVINNAIKPGIRWAIAAAVAVLFLFNIYSLKRNNNKGNRSADFATEYLGYMNSI